MCWADDEYTVVVTRFMTRLMTLTLFRVVICTIKGRCRFDDWKSVGMTEPPDLGSKHGSITLCLTLHYLLKHTALRPLADNLGKRNDLVPSLERRHLRTFTIPT